VSLSPFAGLAVFLAALAFQRGAELSLSARHQRSLVARGAVERGASHYPWIVALHLLWPLALIAEMVFAGARPGRAWPAWLALLLLAQGLRVAAIHALGERWTTRIWVLPGEPPLTRGPYRWLRHPNYVAVAMELVAAPMLFGAWRTALLATLGNAALMAVRIPTEARAVHGAATGVSVAAPRVP
jgi:methyltransferase